MLSNHERRQLALIEQELMARDPAYVARCYSLARKVRRLGAPVRRGPSASPRSWAERLFGLLPVLMLVGGLMLLVVGGATADASIVVAGILLATFALGCALVAPHQSPRRGTA